MLNEFDTSLSEDDKLLGKFQISRNRSSKKANPERTTTA